MLGDDAGPRRPSVRTARVKAYALAENLIDTTLNRRVRHTDVAGTGQIKASRLPIGMVAGERDANRFNIRHKTIVETGHNPATGMW